tara:strand:+ start:436 stop:579 length:144 start_codon:yes stop_codon:yes gene_type:complete
MYKNYSKFVNRYRTKSRKNGPARFGQYPKPSAAMTQRLRLERKRNQK